MSRPVSPGEAPFDAVLFDCDGVLADSEAITNGVLREMLADLGWHLSPEECMRLFVGKTLHEERDLVHRHTGHMLTDAWLAEFRERRNQGLLRDLQPVRNVQDAVAQVHRQFQGRIACASGADRFKIELQLEKCELAHYFAGQVYSGHETPRSKPAPDVYLAAAAGLGADPQRCAVIEDTSIGVTAGVAAGAVVFGYAPLGEDGPLREAGARHIFGDMAELPALLAGIGR